MTAHVQHPLGKRTRAQRFIEDLCDVERYVCCIHGWLFGSAGTTLRYKPGFIVGGDITHDCGRSRGIGYFLEPLVCIALFGKKVSLLPFANLSTDKCIFTNEGVVGPAEPCLKA